MYQHSTEVKVMSITTHQRIEILWGTPHEHSHVVWTFTEHPLGTFVSITNDGLKGEGEDLMALGARCQWRALPWCWLVRKHGWNTMSLWAWWATVIPNSLAETQTSGL